MKKFIYTTAILACSVLATGCDDFLTPENKSNVSDIEYFSTQTGFESLAANAYEKLRNVYATTSYVDYFQAGTDMYCSARNKNDQPLHEYENLTPEHSKMKDLYTYCFNGIRAAYAVKYYVAGAAVSDDLRNKRVDEGRVIAANFYYILVNTFGGVPLIKEYVENIETGYPKASAEEVYTYIIEELEAVVTANHLESSTATLGGGRASMEAARGLLAKTYLAAAWDLGKNEYFAKAGQYADAVINNRSLNTPFANLWKADGSGDDNEEFIWDVEYDYASANNKVDGGHPWSSFYCNYVGGNEDNGKATTSSYVPTVHALEYFAKGDVRYDVTFLKELPKIDKGFDSYWDFYKDNKESYVGYEILRYYPAWYETDEDIAAWRAIDPENRAGTFILPMKENTYDPQNLNNAPMTYDQFVLQVYGGSPCRKFDDSQTALYSNATDYRDIHIITLSEMYLVAAEAYFKAGDDKALDRLNEVRRRANLSPETSIDIDKILKERACELFGQGSRWMDLRRTQKLVEYNNLYNPQLQGKAQTAIGQKLLRPIPQSAIDANDKLTPADQNPGY